MEEKDMTLTEELNTISDDQEDTGDSITEFVRSISDDELVEPITTEIEAEAPKMVPTIRCTATDPEGIVIVGGATADGRGFAMKQFKDRTCPALVMEGCAEIQAIYLDLKEDEPYDIIIAGLDNERCINIIRCDADFNIKQASKPSPQALPIFSLSKWNGDFFIGSTAELNDEIMPILIRLHDDFSGANVVAVKPTKPDHMFQEGCNTPLGKITTMIPMDDRLLFCGSIFNDSESFGFVGVIDTDCKPIVVATIIANDSAFTSADYIWIENDAVHTIGNCISMVDGVPTQTGFTKILDQPQFLGPLETSVN